MNAPVINPSGTVPSFGNFYVLFWTAINLIIPIVIIILLIWYVKHKVDFRKQLLERMDLLIALLQYKNSDQP